jgi:hypothetical protein
MAARYVPRRWQHSQTRDIVSLSNSIRNHRHRHRNRRPNPHRLRFPIRQRPPYPLHRPKLKVPQPDRAERHIEDPHSGHGIINLVVLHIAVPVPRSATPGATMPSSKPAPATLAMQFLQEHSRVLAQVARVDSSHFHTKYPTRTLGNQANSTAGTISLWVHR